jgi:hypothetical protein
LIESTTVVRDANTDVLLDLISDPEKFIEKLRTSYSIKRFTAHFTGPNPKDADEFFGKPLSVYCEIMEADHGKVIVEGADVNSDRAIEVTKSVAATGNEATAKIQRTHTSKPINISLKGDPVKRSYDEEKYSSKNVLDEMRLEYGRVRG